MATLTIKYDARNSIAKKIIDIISTFDFYEIEEIKISKKKSKKVLKSGIDEAIDEVKNGNISTYDNFEDYKKEMRKIVANV